MERESIDENLRKAIRMTSKENSRFEAEITRHFLTVYRERKTFTKLPGPGGKVTRGTKNKEQKGERKIREEGKMGR